MPELLNALFDWLLDPAKRTHYIYWLSSIVVACIWISFAWSKRVEYLRPLVRHQYWLNPSTYQDYFLIFFNRGLFWLLGIPWLIFTLDISLFILNLWKSVGPVQATPITGPLVISLYTLLVFILDDVSRYGLHRLMHKVDFLWRMHQLHHSAATLTPFTTLRIHPLESILYSVRASLVHGLCIGSAFYWLGYQVDSWQVWGASIWVIVFNFLGANLRHSHIPLSYGPLEKWLISPAQHQAHHGVTNMRCNYGSVLAIWDRLGGSWRSGKLNYALPKTAQPLLKQLLLKHISWK